MDALLLGLPLRSQIEREARTAFPRECCGLIEGFNLGHALRATWLHTMQNIATKPDRFEIDPADQFHVLRAARSRGTEIVGCYHSHPNGISEPSQRDREGAGEEGFVWLIAALTDRGPTQLKAFVLRSNVFVHIEIVDEPAS